MVLLNVLKLLIQSNPDCTHDRYLLHTDSIQLRSDLKEAMDKDFIIEHTQAWLNRAVIGLNLCPFAKAVAVKGQIRYVVSEVRTTQDLFDELCLELQRLAQTSPSTTDTTLLIHPQVLQDFIEYNEFLSLAELAVAQLGYQGILQIASFHPDFQFADTEPADISNATNRAPYPILHLLREASIDKAVAAFPEAETIYERNIQTMQKLGVDGWAQLQTMCVKDASGDS